MAETKTLQTLDLYMASFLAFHGIEPSLETVNGKIAFVFSADDSVYNLIYEYNEGAMVEAIRFALVMRYLESQIESLRNKTGLWDWD